MGLQLTEDKLSRIVLSVNEKEKKERKVCRSNWSDESSGNQNIIFFFQFLIADEEEGRQESRGKHVHDVQQVV